MNFSVDNDNNGRRLDRILRANFKSVTLGEIMKSIREGHIRINGKRTRDGATRVITGDIITAPWDKDAPITPKYSGLGNISVIFRGENVIIINKPANILVQPDKPNGDSVITRIKGYTGSNFPAAVHRLDRNTTGALIVALHGEALRALEDLFRARNIRKIYLAVVAGKITDSITVDAPILKDSAINTVKISAEGLKAVTLITPITTNGNISLVQAELLTGRTHQARVHLAHIGHPIIGDRKYGDFHVNKNIHAPRPLLHAYRLIFPQYIDDSLSEIAGKSFTAPLPDDIIRFILSQGIDFHEN